MAHRHGGYIGNGAQIRGIPSLPHGLHGVYISRYASIGEGCRIYQNVTIGEVEHVAPSIGDDCLIGAGAVIIGGVTVGNRVKIGAGAVVSFDVPDDATVVAQPPLIYRKEATPDDDVIITPRIFRRGGRGSSWTVGPASQCQSASRAASERM